MSIIKVKVDISLDTRIHPGSTLSLRGLKGTKNNGGQPCELMLPNGLFCYNFSKILSGIDFRGVRSVRKCCTPVATECDFSKITFL